jgi:capsular exopolysaccharide synthesis family protein
VVGTFRRYVPWILVCSGLVGGVVHGVSDHQAKKYTATASLVSHNNQLGRGTAGARPAGGVDLKAPQSAIVKLVQLRDVAAKVARQLRRRVSEAEVRAALRISAHGGSNIVDVSATASSAKLAAAIANNYAGLVVAKQQSGSAVVTHAASNPRSPSSPDVFRNTALGVALGALLGLVMAFLLDRLGRRIRAPEYLSAIYQLPMLGVVPRSGAMARASRRADPGNREPLPSPEEEAFQLIRTRLRYFNIHHERRTLAVVSAAANDGRTTIARCLASAAARAGAVVLLLEADLRRPALARRLDLQPGPGLSDVLIGSVSLWSATQPVALVEPADSAGHPLELDVLVAGSLPPPNPAELLQSHAMAAVLERTKEMYDLVVIDTSPLSAFGDAFGLLRGVDGVVVAGRVGSNQRRAAKQLHEALERVRAPLLGVIANCVNDRGPGAHAYAPRLSQPPTASAQFK